MQIPLMIRAPGIQGGTRTKALTETIDLYPTLCELAGVKGPKHLQGTSLVSDPEGPDETRQGLCSGAIPPRRYPPHRHASLHRVRRSAGQGQSEHALRASDRPE